MTPKKPAKETDKQEDLFKTKLEDIIDTGHELARLADIIPWDRLDSEYGEMYHESKGRGILFD